jgi:hypothetical protein
MCVGLGCQAYCKVKIDFINGPTHYNETLKKGNELFHETMAMEMLRALKRYLKVVSWKFKNHFCVGLGCQR